MPTVDLDYSTHITGDTKIEHVDVTIAAGENVKQFTPLVHDAVSGHFKATTTDSTEAQYLSSFAVNATSGAVTHRAIKAISISPEAVAWPSGMAEEKKSGLFAGTPISVQPHA